MSKGKVAALRVMREARHKEQSRKPSAGELQQRVEKISVPEVMAQQGHSVPAKGPKPEKGTSDKLVEAKGRQANRQGKKAVTVFMAVEDWKELKNAATEAEITIERFVELAIKGRLKA